MSPPPIPMATPAFQAIPATSTGGSLQQWQQPQPHQPVPQALPPAAIPQTQTQIHATPLPPQYISPSMNAPPLQLTPIAPVAPAAPRAVPPPNLMDEENILPALAQSLQEPPSSAPAPPRPMNPQLLALHNQVHEKLMNEWAKFNASISQESERLRAAQNGLLAGEPAIKDEMARLEAVRDVCRNVSRRVGAVVNAADAAVAELKRKGDPEVDELVCATTIVHNQ